MHYKTSLTLVLSSVLFCIPSFALAAVSIQINQESDMGALGMWTLIYPNQESSKSSEASISLTDLIPGHYSLFAQPPKGTIAHLEASRNGVITETAKISQLSFDVVDGETIVLNVKYELTLWGQVGVNSTPSSIPFELRGPDGLMRAGVTPQTFEKVPIGNYSVQYKPKGCTYPPAKSDVLNKNASVYFSFTLQCNTFVPDKIEEEKTHITAEVKGETVKFNDVPANTWFAPFVATVSKKGILTGYRNASGEFTGTFGPENPVTIAELTKIVHKMANIDETEVNIAPRNQSAIGKWFTKFEASAEERGWQLYQNDQLDLLRPATRGEVLLTLLQVLDIPLAWAKGQMFTDVTVRTPYASAIETAATAGIVSGSTDENGVPTGLFHPDYPITRAEMAKILITIQEKYQQEKE